MIRTLKRVATTTALAAAVVLTLAPGVAEGARKPCTPQDIYADWLDGRIEQAWPASCYRAALKNAPEDLLTYGDLEEDLRAALAQTVRNRKRASESAGGQSPGSTGYGGGDSAGTGAGSNGGSGGGGTPPAGPDTPTFSEPGGAVRSTSQSPPGPDEPKGLFEKAADKVGPGSADEIPLPLIFLAGLALLLVSASAAGFVTRRVQARRVRASAAGAPAPAPPPAEEPPVSP